MTTSNLSVPSHENPDFKSGFITFVGRPNAGKSTLANALVGAKVAITSSTAQTTRRRLYAIRTTDESQMIFVDTPGLHKPHDLLGDELNKSALTALTDTDIACMLIAANQKVGTGDEWVASHFTSLKTPKILIISQADRVKMSELEAQLERGKALTEFDHVVVTSATTGFGLPELVDLLEGLLPAGPHWFAADAKTDQSFEVLVSEFIRESVLHEIFEEVPHGIGVLVEDDSYDEDRNLTIIHATIFVERAGHKGIVIGKGGAKIKQIGTMARKNLKKLLGTKVHLELFVKVKPHWRRDINQINRLGYGDNFS